MTRGIGASLTRACLIALTFFCLVGRAADRSPDSVAFVPGSFDPPTKAHLAIIEEALKKAENVYVMVNRWDAKVHGASFQERADMLQAMLQRYGSRVTIVPEPMDGTMALQARLRSKCKGPFYSFVGQDAFVMPKETIPAKQHYVIVARAGTTKPIPVHPQISALEIADLDEISSTNARGHLTKNETRNGPELERLLPAPVLEYIHERNLYRGLEAGELELKQKEFEQAYLDHLSALAEAQWLTVDATSLRRAFPLQALWRSPPPFDPLQSRTQWPHFFDQYVMMRTGGVTPERCRLYYRSFFREYLLPPMKQ